MDTVVFLVGTVPFVVAFVEFWRRIAVGEPFGTTSNSVVIGREGDPLNSRGPRVLGKGAMVAARILSAAGVASAIGLVVVLALQVSNQ